jgi:hypothetical protein
VTSVIQVMTGEGWTDMMYTLWNHKDSRKLTTGRYIVSFYFLAVVFFLVFFVLNLFLAVISDSFETV